MFGCGGLPDLTQPGKLNLAHYGELIWLAYFTEKNWFTRKLRQQSEGTQLTAFFNFY